MTGGEAESGRPDRASDAARQTPRLESKPGGNPYSSPRTTTVEGKLQPPQKLVWSTRVILFVVGFCGAVLVYLGFYWWAAGERAQQYADPYAEQGRPNLVVRSSDRYGS